MAATGSDSEEPQSLRTTTALGGILTDATGRAKWALAYASRTLALSLLASRVPGATADYPGLDTDRPNYDTFVPEPSDSKQVAADVENFMSDSLRFGDWANRGHAIRSAGSREFCVGNLSVALQGIGAAYSAGSQGAGTLLTLIPTAGVLIGAPAKELWVLYKLCPLAGILSILLSLGGNIIPMEVNEYENIDSFHFQNLIPVADAREKEEGAIGATPSERFAYQVLQRARNPIGAQPQARIYFGMFMQLGWVAAILAACWFLSTGAIIVWWCDFAGWMYVWYAMVCLSSILENFAGVPFTKTWTIRVWRAPMVEIDPNTPWVIPPPIPEEEEPKTPLRLSIPRKPVLNDHVISLDPSSSSSSHSLGQAAKRAQPTIQELQARESFSEPSDILTSLEKGYNTYGNVWMDPTQPWSAANDAFYVLISVRGVSTAHAILRVFSKLISIAVFAIGTGLFASATLITIVAAMITATLILCAGIFGRVTAMWMASEMMRNKPVLHRVVNNRAEAGKYLEEIFRQPEIACEVLGHVVMRGRCIKRFSWRVRWSQMLGVLSRPYDLRRMATNGLVPKYSTENRPLMGMPTA